MHEIPLDSAAEVLPPAYREALSLIGPKHLTDISELRLRTGRAFSALCPDGEIKVIGMDGEEIIASRDDILYVMDRATRSSVHSYQNSIKNGFVTIQGGHRVGICGTAVINNGNVEGFRDFSSLAIRVAKEIKGAAARVLDEMEEVDGICGTLIVSPPGGGKTTLLRDMIRILSKKYRVGVADERSELAGTFRGGPQFDLGEKCDVVDSCPKALAIMLLLRAMNPEIIAVDEITAKEDADALLGALHCGVTLLATAHADNVRDLDGKPMYRALLASGAFKNLIFIRRKGKERLYELVKVKEGQYV
ncbi:MAG: ATPase, T2SS/T4P/T4SS family [Bacillota bacterium]|nr:ATPase, T2SS/T4P/T4SS family [Bacillota bacterium]